MPFKNHATDLNSPVLLRSPHTVYQQTLVDTVTSTQHTRPTPHHHQTLYISNTMADPRPYSTGEIIDHPAFENYEASLLLSEPFAAIQAAEPEHTTPELWEQLITNNDTFPIRPNDRFLVHEPDLVLEDGPDEDPLENGDEHGSDDGVGYNIEIDEMLEIRRENHRHELIQAGFEPEPRVRSYRIAPDMFAGTSLEVPDFSSYSDSYPQQCRAQRAEELEFQGVTSEAFHEMLEEQRSERERIRELEFDLEGCERRLAFEKSKIPAVKAKIQSLADEWCAKDATAYSKFEKHMVNASKCSDAPNRIFQIALWYTKGVPAKLRKAVRELTQRELIVSAYTLDCKKISAEMESEDAWFSPRHLFPDDEFWNMAAQEQTGLNLFFGDDFDHYLSNGFSDCRAPKGRGGEALAQHVMANLETRKIRLEHSINLDEDHEDFEKDKATTKALGASLARFIYKAQEVVGSEMEKLLRDDRDRSPSSQPRPDYQALVDVGNELVNAYGWIDQTITASG